MTKIYSTLQQYFSYRGLAVDLVKRDIKLRYLGSLMGKYWNFIHPIAMISIYTFVFSKVMGARLGGVAGSDPYSYTIYLCAGLLPWNAFIEMVSRGTVSFQDNAHLIKKISFPLNIIPLVATGSATFTLIIAILLYIGLLAISTIGLHPTLLLFPFAFVLQVMFSLGLVQVLSVLQVFFRDIQQVTNIVLQLWFWGTPIVYLKSSVPESFQWIFLLNPFYYFVNIYHKIFIFHTWPTLLDWVSCSLFASITFGLGATFLAHFQAEIPDEL